VLGQQRSAPTPALSTLDPHFAQPSAVQFAHDRIDT
jgi:hypothetical protein